MEKHPKTSMLEFDEATVELARRPTEHDRQLDQVCSLKCPCTFGKNRWGHFLDIFWTFFRQKCPKIVRKMSEKCPKNVRKLSGRPCGIFGNGKLSENCPKIVRKLSENCLVGPGPSPKDFSKTSSQSLSGGNFVLYQSCSLHWGMSARPAAFLFQQQKTDKTSKTVPCLSGPFLHVPRHDEEREGFHVRKTPGPHASHLKPTHTHKKHPSRNNSNCGTGVHSIGCVYPLRES